MKEIEAKILEIDRRAVETTVQKLGARKVFDGVIDFRYFDLPGGRLKDRGVVLRLRKKGAIGELTVKTNLMRTVGAKTAKEIESSVDFEKTKIILETLGFKETLKTKKHRIEYVLGDVHFEIDKLPGIPWFLEIEAPSAKKILQTAKLLGFSKKDIKPWWLEDVKKHYGIN